MQKVSIILTIQDGNSTDSGCLEECRRQIDQIEAEEKYSFSIFLNNEGQNGWQPVWERVSKEGFDFFIWIDYDLRLKENALSSLLENSEFLRHKAIIAGTVAAPDRTLLFGGRTRHGRLLEPDQTIPVPCHFYDMDLVMIPEYALLQIDVPSGIFKQGFFDYGFGDKAVKAGVARVIAPGVLAEADRKVEVPVWNDSEYPFSERCRSFLKVMNKGIAKTIHSLFK